MIFGPNRVCLHTNRLIRLQLQFSRDGSPALAARRCLRCASTMTWCRSPRGPCSSSFGSAACSSRIVRWHCGMVGVTGRIILSITSNFIISWTTTLYFALYHTQLNFLSLSLCCRWTSDRRVQAEDQSVPARTLHQRQWLQAGRERGHIALPQRQGQDPGESVSQVFCGTGTRRWVPRVAAHYTACHLCHVFPHHLAGSIAHWTIAKWGKDRDIAHTHGTQSGYSRGDLAGQEWIPNRTHTHCCGHICRLRNWTDT